jgi:A/G-specific DNA glycosylase
MKHRSERVQQSSSKIRVSLCASVAFQSAKFRRRLLSWYRRHGRDLPWRRTRDPYAILVSEFMLQQTQVATVIPYYHKWLRSFPISPHWRALRKMRCFARGKASAITLAREISTPQQKRLWIDMAETSRGIEQMRQLSGIGKYTAHAVASFAFNQSVPIVEANTGRVLARLFNLRKSIDSDRAGEHCGNMQRVFSQNPMPRLSTPHSSILARSFA